MNDVSIWVFSFYYCGKMAQHGWRKFMIKRDNFLKILWADQISYSQSNTRSHHEFPLCASSFFFKDCAMFDISFEYKWKCWIQIQLWRCTRAIHWIKDRMGKNCFLASLSFFFGFTPCFPSGSLGAEHGGDQIRDKMRVIIWWYKSGAWSVVIGIGN